MTSAPVQHITGRNLIGPAYAIKRIVMPAAEILFDSRDIVALSLPCESRTQNMVVEAMAEMDGHPNLRVVYLRHLP